jgi:Xaa-Pro aminopeptidase
MRRFLFFCRRTRLACGECHRRKRREGVGQGATASYLPSAIALRPNPNLIASRYAVAAVTDTILLKRRRQALMQALGEGLLVLPTAPHLLRNGDTHHEFRPGSDFEYLTGFPEPGSTLVLQRRGRRVRATLFVPPRDKEREIWDGRRLGPSGALRHCGVDAAFASAELDKRLPDLLLGQGRVFVSLGKDEALDARLRRAFERVAQQNRRASPPAHPALVDPAPALAELRKRKDPLEIALLERAAEVTAMGHVAAMRDARPGMREYELQALIECEFKRGGARRTGYGSIVAGGKNACILHYVENSARLRSGDLVLIDAGAEYHGYTADVTRTFPVSGKFTDAQRRVYEVVLRAQRRAIAAVRPGARWNRPHEVAVRELTRGLVELGVLRKRGLARLVAKLAFRPWYMHGTSHWLGRDVHDVGAYQDEKGRPLRLRPGNVLTVEPGLYFAPGDRRVPESLRGIGIRIEDDLLVTERGHRVLTAAVPKGCDEIEAACGRG